MGLSFDQLVKEIGAAGQQVTHLEAAEAAAGNISVFTSRLEGRGAAWQPQGEINLPCLTPALAGGWVLVSGAGRRLRDLATNPEATLCVLEILPGGGQAVLYTAPGVRPTSELNSHLAIHQDHVERRGLGFHAIVHAQSPYLVYLSHLPAYADTLGLNRRLLRWEPETILTFPEGIGMVPFQVPGSPEQMAATLPALRRHRAIVWQRHGTVTRADESVTRAADLVEYAETAARYEYLNLSLGEPTQGLSPAELRKICMFFNVEQDYF